MNALVLKIVFLVALVGLTLWLCSACFAYSLDTIFGKDVPWYADLVGGLVLNGANIAIAVVCWIITLAGVEVPLAG